jgi:hypothetical protein
MIQIIFLTVLHAQVKENKNDSVILSVEGPFGRCHPQIPTGLFADSITYSSAKLHAPYSGAVSFSYAAVTDGIWKYTDYGNSTWI